MRIGKFGYLNNYLPYYWLEKQGYDVVESNPREMTELLGSSIDFAPVPAFYYLLNKDRLRSYNFCVASTDRVISVLVVSRNNKDLNKGSIAITNHSMTSVNLLKVILREKGMENKLVAPHSSKPTPLLDNSEYALVIGDEAIKARMLYRVVMDLGEEWYELTGKPMVFGISASLKGVDASATDELVMESIDWGWENLEEIVAAAESKFKMPGEFLEEYFKTLSYKMRNNEKKGLNLFEVLCHEHGLLPYQKSQQ